jgi:soluble lytic murein transglycosylase-like protein
VTDPFDARQNVRAGALHLRRLLDRFGQDLRLALAAYNAGAAAVERHGNQVPPFAETLAYVPRVLRLAAAPAGLR